LFSLQELTRTSLVWEQGLSPKLRFGRVSGS